MGGKVLYYKPRRSILHSAINASCWPIIWGYVAGWILPGWIGCGKKELFGENRDSVGARAEWGCSQPGELSNSFFACVLSTNAGRLVATEFVRRWTVARFQPLPCNDESQFRGHGERMVSSWICMFGSHAALAKTYLRNENPITLATKVFGS
jgi:hypothetical protein